MDNSDCVKNVILSEAKDLKWPKNEILRYTQNDKKREKCFFTQSELADQSKLIVTHGIYVEYHDNDYKLIYI